MKCTVKKETLSDKSLVYNLTIQIPAVFNATAIIGGVDAHNLKKQLDEALSVEIEPAVVPDLLCELIKAKNLRQQAQEALQWLEELPIDERDRLETIIEWDAPITQLAEAIDNTEGIHAVVNEAQSMKTCREDTCCRNHSISEVPAGKQAGQMKKEDVPRQDEKCPACKERGWLLTSNDKHGLRVEKCDTCDKFESDDHAATVAWPVLSQAVEAASLCKEALVWLEDSFEAEEQPAALVKGLRTLCEAVKHPVDLHMPCKYSRRKNETITGKTLTAALKEQCADAPPKSTEVKLLSEGGKLWIRPEGYGDKDSLDGHGYPVSLEIWEGRLRLIVFNNINVEEPQIIDLENARETARMRCNWCRSEIKGEAIKWKGICFCSNACLDECRAAQ